MRLSRLFLPLFFAFALLAAQHGSAVHAFSHWFAEQGQAQDKQAPHSTACEKCASYAQLGSALPSAEHDFVPGKFSEAGIALPASPFFSLHPLAARARGPPAAPQLIA